MSSTRSQHKRTPILWMVYFGFALLTLAGFLRMVDSILNWYWLSFSGVRPGPWYLVASGGLWGVVGLAALGWVWLPLPRYRLVGAGAALFYGLSYWIDRLFVGSPEAGLPNSGFGVLITLLGLALVFLALRPWIDLNQR